MGYFLILFYTFFYYFSYLLICFSNIFYYVFYVCSGECRFLFISFGERGAFYIFILCDVGRGVEITVVKGGWEWGAEVWFGWQGSGVEVLILLGGRGLIAFWILLLEKFSRSGKYPLHFA